MNNLPPTPSNPAQAIPNNPFYVECSDTPYLEGPYSPILVGCGLKVCGDYLVSIAGEVPVPVQCLAGKGSLITALGPETPATLLAGESGQFLTVDLNEPAGLKWVWPPNTEGCVPCSAFTAKGDILVGESPNTPTALPVGTNGQYLTVNSNTSTGVEWADFPYEEFTQKGQLLISCSADCALAVSGSHGDILCYNIASDTGWTPVKGCDVFVPQSGFERGVIVVGCDQNQSGKLPPGPDGNVLVTDSTCALGVKWKDFGQNAKQTNGMTFCTAGEAVAQPVSQLSAASFPANCQVFVSMTGAWNGCGERRNGFLYMRQGDHCSCPMGYNNGSNNQDDKSTTFFNLTYIIPSWCAAFACPLLLIVDNRSGGTTEFQVQTSAFILKS